MMWFEQLCMDNEELYIFFLAFLTSLYMKVENKFNYLLILVSLLTKCQK